MEFKALRASRIIKDYDTSALEATSENVHTIDIEGQSMHLSLITDDIINSNNLAEVYDPIYFKTGTDPTDGGLFSKVIFGDTPKERMRNHACIDLKRKYFHPYIFEVIVKMNRNINIVASGQGAWYINPMGELEQITDVNDSRYNEDNTGLVWLIDNFHKIKFKDTGSDKRKAQLQLINSLSDEEIFITKWIVIPVFYRDYDNSSGVGSIPEINRDYCSIIMNTRSYDDEILSFRKHDTLYKVQKTLVKIRQDGQRLIEKKKGAFQKTVLGKANTFGARGVISVPSLTGCDVPNDCIVDILHSGIPIAKCLEAGKPFIMKWVTEFFEEMFRNKRTIPAYKVIDGKSTLEYVDIIDQTERFTVKYIEDKMEMFHKTYGYERFETVKVKCKDGSESEIYFPGKYYTTKPDDPRANTIGMRPLTWTDVFYLAAENTLTDKHCYITRYPLEDYFGIFPSKVAVLSTINTIPVIVNGKLYPHYPMIDLTLRPDQVATQFIDTITISNLYLDAIGGDYDGDTVSIKILFTIEANQEAAEALNDIKHYVSIQGNLVRVLSNETYLSFYNMTRRE